ncbi:hypothetical protein GGR04_001825 [Aureimonas pseudogalii]|uniref:Uncharacterized protein n=1 Tax=Aureimonas pseudogalii TaxID=1744844 RepID=A0A7W6EAY9_9HYPH|nr:hypothetical protein [Aureimonas pseudogalii]
MSTSCLAAAAPLLDGATATVDPFGSAHFGLAVLAGREPGGTATRSVICAYDKASGRAEVGGALELAQAMPTGAREASRTGDLAAPFGGRCAEECEAALSTLSDGDREAVIGLPTRIARTLAALEGTETDGGTRQALDVAASVAGSDAANAPALVAPVNVTPVEAECTLRWFGFLDESAKTVGTHRCTVAAAADGSVTIEKLTGERLRLRLLPLNDRLSLTVGRSFLADQPERAYDLEAPLNAGNGNFGNVVGLATRSGGQIHLFGGAELGMQPADDTFFSILTISGT